MVFLLERQRYKKNWRSFLQVAPGATKSTRATDLEQSERGKNCDNNKSAGQLEGLFSRLIIFQKLVFCTELIQSGILRPSLLLLSVA